MSLTAWRITKRKHARSAFDGEGARKFGGRWNSRGLAAVYTAENQALAVLEILVHLDNTELLQRYVLIGVEIEEALIQTLDPRKLPRNWRDDPAPQAAREIGDEWLRAGPSAVLKVPSTLVPSESNLLLNPLHPDFRRLRIGNPISFSFDLRLTRQTPGSSD